LFLLKETKEIKERKKQRTGGGRLYRGESKLWPVTAPSSSSSSRPVLAATLVATLPPEQTDARATKGNKERGRLGTKKN
jgi:hypothetical protein